MKDNIRQKERAWDVETMLAEDLRRQAERSKKFDPISGENSVGERFLFRCRFPLKIKEDMGLKSDELWLPVRMLREGLVKMLQQKGAASEEDAESFDRLRCRYDFCYWAARYVYIKRKGGGHDITFILNAPQRRMVEIFESQRLQEAPIRVILLKARQWGGSTCSQLYMAWLQLVQEVGLNSLIIAHQGSGSEEIKDMFDRMIERYPMRMLMSEEEASKGVNEKEKKIVSIGRSGAAFRLIRRNCKIKIGTAERPDSCRGGDYNLVHLSEVGVWKKTLGKSPEDIVRSACSGVLQAPNTMIVYESTANGTGNFFHREYEAAKRGESQFEAMFVSWYEIAHYSSAVADKEGFARELLEMQEQKAASDNRHASGRYLWQLWERGATLEAIYWYVNERAKYNDDGQMASEYPSDDIEAFVHSGARVFDRYLVENLRRDCRVPPLHGEVESDGDFGEEALRNIRFVEDRCGCMDLWKLPERDENRKVSERYLVVVDIGGRSAGADWSVVAVFDRVGLISGGGPELVAQWRGHCDMDILAWKAARIAAFYDEALLVVESNTLETHDAERMVDGDQSGYILNQIRDVYPNLYARHDSEDAVRRGEPVRYGFHTNSATKPMVISTLVRMVREGLYTERDERCLDEYLCYERRQNGSYGAIPGRHDDLLMTRAIGLHICMHEMSMPQYVDRRRAGIRRRRDTLISEAMF